VRTTVRELKDCLSVLSEPSSDWGHDLGFGLVYQFADVGRLYAAAITSSWEPDGIFISRFSAC